MKICQIFLLINFLLIASCSFKNSKTVTVLIDSEPHGAKILIDGYNYGITPLKVNLIPENHILILRMNGVQQRQEMETQYRPRRDKKEGRRCLMDAFGSMFIIPMFSLYSVNCRDFDRDKYFVDFSNLNKN